jgi:hypothetical protein
VDLGVPESFEKENPSWERLIYPGRSRTYPTGIPQSQAYFRSILLDEDALAKTGLFPANDSFFQLAAGFIAYLYKCSYPPLFGIVKWKEYLESLPDECHDPLRFHLFLEDATDESSLKWPGATCQSVFQLSVKHVGHSRKLSL